MKYQVFVRLKPGVLDVQGKAIEGGIHSLGYEGLSNVRVGKLIEFSVNERDPDVATKQVQEICEKLLANTVIEDFEIKEA